MKILVIEDEVELSEVIVRSLEREHFVVETARDKSEALRRVADHDYDLVLLDIMLPGGSGLEVLRAMKEAGKAGNVIIISAKDSLDDKLAGLDLGADDYLTKPFHIAELNARVRSVLRRKNFGGSTTLDAANLRLDPEERTVHVDHTPLALEPEGVRYAHLPAAEQGQARYALVLGGACMGRSRGPRRRSGFRVCADQEPAEETETRRCGSGDPSGLRHRIPLGGMKLLNRSLLHLSLALLLVLGLWSGGPSSSYCAMPCRTASMKGWTIRRK
jgi:DNA-binding response OmpR family regulator